MADLKVCDGGTQGKGDSFYWINEHDVDCTLTHCMPPLTQDTYKVPKKVGGVPGKTLAQVQPGAQMGDYSYHPDCCKKLGDPIIKIQ